MKPRLNAKITPAAAHEEYLQRVRALACARFKPATKDERTALVRMQAAKVVYGVGRPHIFGQCFHMAWDSKHPLVEICAYHEENRYQLAATLIHELAHAGAGPGAGHGAAWRKLALRLGLTAPKSSRGANEDAAAQIDAALRAQIDKLADPREYGVPHFARSGGPRAVSGAGGCRGGTGARGGTSRGPGSGSRLRLYQCKCDKPVKVRVASDSFAAHCDTCGEAFKQP